MFQKRTIDLGSSSCTFEIEDLAAIGNFELGVFVPAEQTMNRAIGKQMMRQVARGLQKATGAKGHQTMPRLVDCRQGEKVTPTFSRKEMQQRIDKLRASMAEQEIEACVFTSYHNINYFSDFLYCAFGRPYGLVVTDEQSTVIGASKYAQFLVMQ